MSGIGIISNPFARINKRDPQYNVRLHDALGNRGIFRITENLSDLSWVAKEFKERGISHVGIVGGDGTISLTLAALLREYHESSFPKIFVLRGGTVNVLASNLGISGMPREILLDCLSAWERGRLKETPYYSLKANGRLGFLFANGGAARFLQAFYSNKGNAWDAALLLSRIAAGGLVRRPAFLAPASSQEKLPHCTVRGDLFHAISRLEEMTLETEPCLNWRSGVKPTAYSNIFISTIPRMAYGIPFYKLLEPGKPHAQITAMANEGRSLIFQAARGVMGLGVKNPNAHEALIQSAHIKMEPGSLWSLDGELFDAPETGVSIEMGPRFVFCSPQ